MSEPIRFSSITSHSSDQLFSCSWVIGEVVGTTVVSACAVVVVSAGGVVGSGGVVVVDCFC